MLDLPAGTFEPSIGQWQLVQPAIQPVERKALLLATMNIWFGDYFAVERYRAIADLLLTHKPDFIALQEVTPKALRIFLNQGWIQQNYFSTDIDGSTLGDYGVMIFSRLPIKSIRLMPLLSAMGRQLLIVETLVNGVLLHIVTVHLESTKSKAMIRGQQLAQIFGALVEAQNVALIGDFNFCASWQAENDRLDPAYTDVWGHLRPDEPGFTEDTHLNLMRYLVKGEHKQVRFDRVLLKSPHWAASSIDLLGTEPISLEAPDIFPSDHFGLLCGLSVR